jgi:uncharacterized membrane protein
MLLRSACEADLRAKHARCIRVSKGRVESFSDGIFAIAITLLVLTIPAPDDYHNLAEELRDRWPGLAAYVVSFAVIGIMWFNHNVVFSHFARVDRGLIYLNLFLLLTVVFIPYPTGIFGEALGQDAGARVAAVAYSIAMTVNAYAWAAVWLYGSLGRRLLSESFPEPQRMPATVRFTAGPILYSSSIAVAFINPYACLAFHGLLALYYAVDPLSWRRRTGAPA